MKPYNWLEERTVPPPSAVVRTSLQHQGEVLLTLAQTRWCMARCDLTLTKTIRFNQMATFQLQLAGKQIKAITTQVKRA